MKLAIGCDHRGLTMKKQVIDLVKKAGHSIDDLGTYTEERMDYPAIAKTVGEAVAAGKYQLGILICGTGIGVSIAANKVKGIRAANVCNAFGACRSRQHNDANILCLGAENDCKELPEIIHSFLTCQFEGGRHQTRVDMIRQMEG